MCAPTPEAYQEYGKLLNKLGDNEAASMAYQDGLSMVAGSSLPAIPHMQSDDAEDAETGENE